MSVSTFRGGITNSGLIAGSGTALGKGFGIYLDPPTFLGNIANTGTIIGAARRARRDRRRTWC